jgi:serine/threonine-protein kinase HipA
VYTVYLYDRLIGVIERRGTGLRFTYSPSALSDDALPALSLSLPKRAEPYADRKAGVYFRNLLPEQAYRRLIAAAAGATVDDATALLGAIGGECPGAVSIWPEDQAPPKTHEYQHLSTDDLEQLLEPASPRLGDAVIRGRLSLPGVQPKIALFRDDDGAWMLPLRGAVTTHIVKRSTDDYPHLAENELACTALARAVGIGVPDWCLVPTTRRAFGVERFDRVPSDDPAGPPRRKLHQEDFCQILSVRPEMKYQAEGGPGVRQCADVIREHCVLPAVDLPALVKWVGFNYLIGNADAHAKNLALMYTDRGLQLSPHYDLVSTEVYPHVERALAMKIGSTWDIRNVQKSDWRRFAGTVRLPWSHVRALLSAVADAMAGAVAAVMEQQEDQVGTNPIFDGIRHVVDRHLQQLGRELMKR